MPSLGKIVSVFSKEDVQSLQTDELTDVGTDSQTDRQTDRGRKNDQKSAIYLSIRMS